MPNRLIRDGMLESEAVLSLPVDARWLYLAVLLSADDVGLFEATEFRLARRADVRRELAGKLLQMLADADLVRLYPVGAKVYGFIPKFRQRIQIKRSRHPHPPASLIADDDDAVSKFKDLASKTTVGQPLRNGSATAAQRSEPEPEPERKAKTNTPPPDGAGDAAAPLVSFKQLVAEGVDKQVAADWLKVRRAKKLALTLTAWDGTKAEAAKANLPIGVAIKTAVLNSWGGFKAAWLDAPDTKRVQFGAADKAATVPPKETAAEYAARMAAERAAEKLTPEEQAKADAARRAAVARAKGQVIA